ncbi:MAG: hypothetical protein IPJ29_15165 [Chitinophagaceae bacterium]|nr:hypothetical protein [Chitinophagaceae bacterium]
MNILWGFFKAASISAFGGNVCKTQTVQRGFLLGCLLKELRRELAATDLDPGTSYFVVANYIFNTVATTDDVSKLWVNPALGGSEPAPEQLPYRYRLYLLPGLKEYF